MKRLLSVCLSVALLVIFFTISISAETYSVIALSLQNRDIWIFNYIKGFA